MPKLVIEQRFVEDLYMDPVMAATVIFNEPRMDAFQRAMLRYMWFCPISMDSSGQGSGKTWMMWIYAHLRAVMLPDQWVIYMPPSLDQGERMFWNKYGSEHYLKPGVAPLFVSQLRRMRGSQTGQVRREGFIVRKFRNESQILMLPPSVNTEGKSAAGEDCNTIVFEEWMRHYDSPKGAMAMDGQFASRSRRPCKHPSHPIKGNHQHYSGHAEEPSHPSAARYDQYARQIRDGSLSHAQFSFCYKDFSPENRKRVVNEKLWADEKGASPALYRRKYLGLRTGGMDVFYPPGLFRRAYRTGLVPEPQRGRQWGADAEYIVGFDVAPAMTEKADWSAFTVVRLRPVDQRYMEMVVKNGDPSAGFVLAGKVIYEIAIVNANRMPRKMRPVEMAGVIHWLNIRYGFTSINMDPKGGGTLVYGEMKQPRALVAGEMKQVIPLTTARDARADTLGIVNFFQMDSDFAHLPHIGEAWLKDEAGLIAATHNQCRKRLVAWQIAFPAPLDHHRRSKASVQEWTPEMVEASKGLALLQREWANVGQRIKNGNPMVSSHGYPLFGARGKKDVAMSAVMAFAGVETRLHELSEISAHGEDFAP